MKYLNTRNKINKIWIDFNKDDKQIKVYKKVQDKVSNKVKDLNRLFYFNKNRYDYSSDFEVVNLTSHLSWYIGNKEWQVTLNNIKLSYLTGIDYNVAIKGESLSDNYLYSDTDELIEVTELDSELELYRADYKIRWDISLINGNDIQAKLFFYIKNPLNIR